MPKYLNGIIYLLFLLIISCTRDGSTGIHYCEKNISADNYDMIYESGGWDHPDYKNAFESYGNHRIVIEVNDTSSGMVQVLIPWRRRDDNPREKDLIVVDSKTNKPVQSKQVVAINNESGHVVFKPNIGSSLYYIYYFPHRSTGGYYPKLSYIRPEESSDTARLTELKLTDDQIAELPIARIISAQSIDDFHSFFPMEIIATQEEISDFIHAHPKPYWLFPEYREHPIKMEDYLPKHWVDGPDLANGIRDEVQKGEFYTFQIGIFSAKNDLDNIRIAFSDFKGKKGVIPQRGITCFNTGGTDLNGKVFDKKVDVKAGKIQALWFGIEIPEETKPEEYLGQVIIQPEGFIADTVYVSLDVSSNTIKNYGDDDPAKMSRLRWLNSTIGSDKDFIVKPFMPLVIDGKTIRFLGRDVELNEYGFPAKISSFFTQEMTKLKTDKEEIIIEPIHFDIILKDGSTVQWNSSAYTITQEYGSEAKWSTTNGSDDFFMEVTGTAEYDGMIDYKVKLIVRKDTEIKDAILQIPLHEEAAEYMLGLGFKGGKRQENISWKWDVKNHHEGAWLGAINKGLQYVLRDENYERPLNTNFYQQKPLNLPSSWYNEGKGGINIKPGKGYVAVENYSGGRILHADDTLNFNIRFLITPFKPVNTKDHFNTRFVHKYVPVDSVVKWRGTIVNVHHANEINPYINYPFYNTEKQKAYIDEAHSKGIKVKLYNTIRELTYKSYELFALKSLGDEVLNDGDGGGHSWLQEHFKSNYHAAWHATSVNDAAVLNKGNSRWTNYYIEGINWLAKNQKIDGLYLDDIAFSRATVKRINAVINQNRDEVIIDLHSANQFNERDGFINSAFLYMEHMPYITRLWFGEYFEYDLGPDYWLTEVSGLPFGLMGEMLEKGGHPYRGLVYGMTSRIYGNIDMRPIWKLFDDFDIANSEMLGYWVDRSPIKTNVRNIKSTVYVQNNKVLIAIGSWSEKEEKVPLQIDWDALGMDKNNARLISPEIEGLQKSETFDIDQSVPVEKNQGLILILELKNK